MDARRFRRRAPPLPVLEFPEERCQIRTDQLLEVPEHLDLRSPVSPGRPRPPGATGRHPGLTPPVNQKVVTVGMVLGGSINRLLYDRVDRPDKRRIICTGDVVVDGAHEQRRGIRGGVVPTITLQPGGDPPERGPAGEGVL
jgi:hypothetical protein